MMSSKSFIFRFDDVEVHEREFKLVKAGGALAVEPKAFRVLLILLRYPGKLIGKEDLLNAVWGDAAVTDNSLARSVALLRRLLGDEARDPRYIETVATVGYRFVCKVEVSEDGQQGMATQNPVKIGNGDASQAAPVEAQGRESRRLKRKWVLASAILAVCLFILTSWYLHRPQPPIKVTYSQITHDGRRKFAVGTDGVRLYLIGPIPYPVTQVAVTGGDAAPLPVPLPFPRTLSVSPDGSTLSFSSGRGEQASLWSLRVLGGALHHLADGGIVDATWSPDGKSIIYSKLNGDIDVMRSDGTESHRVTVAEDHSPNSVAGDLSWSPDGSRIRFSRGDRIFEMLPDGSGVHPLFPDWQPSSMACGGWSPDGRFFSFRVKDQIWLLDERSGLSGQRPAKPVQLTSGPITWCECPFFGKDSRTIFATGAILSGELNRLDTHAHRFLPWLGGISAEFLTFSPDGKSLAYVTFPEGILFRANRDGSNPVQLTNPPLYPTVLRWSPDGAQISFCAQDAAGHWKIYVLPSGGGTPQMLLPEDHEPQSDPNWSPDGRKIVFGSSPPAWDS